MEKENVDVIKKQFGQRVKTLRSQLGLSQEALADKCALDRTYISGIERGIRNPTLEIVIRLANGLNVTLPTLFRF